MVYWYVGWVYVTFFLITSIFWNITGGGGGGTVHVKTCESSKYLRGVVSVEYRVSIKTRIDHRVVVKRCWLYCTNTYRRGITEHSTVSIVRLYQHKVCVIVLFCYTWCLENNSESVIPVIIYFKDAELILWNQLIFLNLCGILWQYVWSASWVWPPYIRGISWQVNCPQGRQHGVNISIFIFVIHQTKRTRTNYAFC